MAIVGLLLLLATAGFTLRVTARGGAGAIGVAFFVYSLSLFRKSIAVTK